MMGIERERERERELTTLVNSNGPTTMRVVKGRTPSSAATRQQRLVQVRTWHHGGSKLVTLVQNKDGAGCSRRGEDGAGCSDMEITTMELGAPVKNKKSRQ
jgi:hypothetical protein